ncbi:hypothetical protein NCTC2275_03356 [Mycobacterium marinum]|nr:hypothetical protein NCTC2275_03356 [Mycobacterium marinum]
MNFAVLVAGGCRCVSVAVTLGCAVENIPLKEGRF